MTAPATMSDEDAPPAGFAPLDNVTEAEAFNGPYYIRRSTDAVSIGFRVHGRHLNAAGICHGGVIGVFADMQGYAIEVGNFSGAAPTINLSLDFLAAIRRGDWVEATPQVTRDTRSLTFFRSVITVDGSPVASCHGIYKKRSPAGGRGNEGVSR
jgi:uncharacterized protein (TIGR00369 family)